MAAKVMAMAMKRARAREAREMGMAKKRVWARAVRGMVTATRVAGDKEGNIKGG